MVPMMLLPSAPPVGSFGSSPRAPGLALRSRSAERLAASVACRRASTAFFLQSRSSATSRVSLLPGNAAQTLVAH
jgi:hypothetical protein